MLEEACLIFYEMQLAGVMPNRITFNALLSACAKCGNIGRAKFVFSEMKRALVPPDVVTFNALISACEKAKDVEVLAVPLWS